MTAKELFAAWAKVKDGYDGPVTCREVRSEKGCTFYVAETDGGTFELAQYEDNPDLLFYREEGVCYSWATTFGVQAMELNGMPVLPPWAPETSLYWAEILAAASGKSVATVYRLANKLGRWPTLDEFKAVRTGRPKKYK